MRCVKFLAVILAAAMLFAGCGGIAGTVDSSRPQAAQQVCSLPNDGKLRLFSGESGSTVVFHGSKVVYEAKPTDVLFLLTDDYTGKTDYFVVGRLPDEHYDYTIYTADGEEYYQCGSKHISFLMNGWAALVEESDYDWDVAPEDTEAVLLHLATGNTKILEKGSAVFSLVGDYFAVQNWNYDYETGEDNGSFVDLYDHDWELVRHMPGYSSVMETDMGKEWLYFTDEKGSALINMDTDEQLRDVTLCGGYAYAEMDDDFLYRVYDIRTRELLGVYREVGNYLDGDMLYWSYRGDELYPCLTFTLETADENGGELLSADKNVCYLAGGKCLTSVRLADEIRLYDVDGSLLFAQPFSEPTPGQEWDDYYCDPLAGEKAILVKHYAEGDSGVWNRPVCEYFLLDANGVRWTLEGEAAARYSSIYSWMSDGYLLAERADSSSMMGYLYDVLSVKDGSVLVSGVSNVGGSEGDMILCRRGFEEGWMNLQGEWLWHRSIWQTASDEISSRYY